MDSMRGPPRRLAADLRQCLHSRQVIYELHARSQVKFPVDNDSRGASSVECALSRDLLRQKTNENVNSRAQPEFCDLQDDAMTTESEKTLIRDIELRAHISSFARHFVLVHMLTLSCFCYFRAFFRISSSRPRFSVNIFT